MEIENHYEKTYQDVLEEVCESLKVRRRDPSFTLEVAEQTLQSLYVSQGNNWVGRGAVAELSMDATIAAYEQMIAQWKEEKKAENSSP